MSTKNSYAVLDQVVNRSIDATPVKDYSKILENHHLDYCLHRYYWQVGQINSVQGWILHLSVIKTQIENLLEVIIPILTEANIPFRVAKDRETARCILDGNLGYYKVGKVLGIYPNTDEEALSIAKTLIQSCRGFHGPSVLTDIHLGGIVYSRYGAFRPISVTEYTGLTLDYIYDNEGNLVPDLYTIPYSPPAWAKWPFSSIVDPRIAKPNKTINNSYRPISVLKHDAKGDVIKALYMKNLFSLRWCVIKKGKKHMWSDDHERTMLERLKWQQFLHKELAEKIRIPKLYDFFVENDESHLVLEYIKGKSIYDKLAEINTNCLIWYDLDPKKQIIVLGYIIEIIDTLQTLHNNGYIHRDITPVNFMIDKGGQLVLIDIELVYSIRLKKPNPPFLYGTPGFISPEQEANETPTVNQDIYGLGGLMVQIFTSLPPITFDHSDQPGLANSINFYVRNEAISRLIAACLSANPSDRPSLSTIKSHVSLYMSSISDKSYLNPKYSAKVAPTILPNLINRSLHGLSIPPMLYEDGLWQSKALTQDNLPGIEKSEFTNHIGLFAGISGIIYLLAKAKAMGYQIDSCKTGIENGWRFIDDAIAKSQPTSIPGLYYGTAGVAAAMASCIDAGILEDTKDNRSKLKDLFSIQTEDASLANGISGQGVAIMKCRKYLDLTYYNETLKGYVQKLCDKQENGQWIALMMKKKKKVYSSDFSIGNAGITWFLLQYSKENSNQQAERVALSSLTLLTQLVPTTLKIFKKQGPRGVLYSIGQLGSNVIGMILTLLKAYEVLQDVNYKKLAEELLMQTPENIVTDNFTQSAGLASLGELYLEAYLTLKNDNWLKRADFIALLLSKSHRNGLDGSSHWLGNKSFFPTADLMIGNSGIIHFLIRYLNHNKLGYIVLS